MKLIIANVKKLKKWGNFNNEEAIQSYLISDKNEELLITVIKYLFIIFNIILF
jgi:hypothetical protein